MYTLLVRPGEKLLATSVDFCARGAEWCRSAVHAVDFLRSTRNYTFIMSCICFSQRLHNVQNAPSACFAGNKGNI